MKRVVVLLPAYNEEETIGKVIDEIPVKKLEKEGYKVTVVVANGPSTDRTEEIARNKGAIVYNIAKGGKARDVKHALSMIDFPYDYLVMLDADYTYPPQYIYDIVKALEEYDVVIGSRLKGKIEDGAMPKVNKLGNWGLSLIATILYGKKISDVCTGMWGFRKYVLDSIEIDANGFDLEANLYVEAVKKGFKIGEVPINYRKRPNKPKLGNGNPWGAVKTGLKIGWYLVRKRFK
ncbi:glycosyltransferase family 2 protein [Pyrococcus abyssi]|uniref:Glycosyltransferase n=1 Tax=Pyrococcus abyssi (strain GE5 / Orsay) TaxID=272844 RepID=Q9UZF6_PYRAB|nr:glycosyltransferase family 2 protein [Pyrococcus abyssi]CAB50103.1 Glycosyltransferase family protein, substrate unknown [Pyrococcus abyssi GE5]CCE70623.1 TPA: glycosyltransferase [Pyrococcus abyssi GE5]